MKKSLYASPTLHVLGSISDITKASFTNSQQDSIFFAGINVGSAQGSRDACVSRNAQSPSGNCTF